MLTINEKAFSESSAAIFSSITNADWPLLDDDLRPVIAHKPAMPLTTLQKRWLKSLISDPMIALFDPDTTGLEDIEHLYRQDTFVMFDRYGDGDPYDDSEYAVNFRTVLQAVREKRMLRDERNALERAALHFSHFEKEIQKPEEGSYQIKLRYDKDDETELLIRVLSFGPVLQVKSPRPLHPPRQRADTNAAGLRGIAMLIS